MTLLEALVSLALLGLVIGILGKLAWEYQRILQFSGGRDKHLIATRTLESIQEAVTESLDVVTPEGDDTNAQSLVLKMRFPRELGSVSSPSSGSLDREYLLRFDYSDSTLYRQIGSGEKTVMMEEVEGFSVNRRGEESIEVMVSIADKQSLVSFRMEAFRWVR